MKAPLLCVIDRQDQTHHYQYPPHLSEQITELNQALIKQKFASAWLTIEVAHHAQDSLDQLFACLQQLYRPLMRQKGCQLWVCWQGECDPATTEGAKALTQIAALELAAKQVSINFISSAEPITQTKQQALLTWPQARYLTAQAVPLTDA